ncbi:MAG: hypothetical protein LBV26_05285 [Bacteroidales bacterium]|nr:hypothetical protein [Bacteroidales bacterium]
MERSEGKSQRVIDRRKY